MVGKSQTTLAGRQRLRVVNVRLSLPPSSDQFSIITTTSEIEEKNSLSFWDALIVAAALRLQAQKIITEDLNHGQIIEGILVENPLVNK
jgi:predicted nucleic acid-binding protein